MTNEEDLKKPEIDEYTINVRVEGYGGLSMNMKVPAKDPDDAFTIACSTEFRYADEDPYVLMVVADDEQLSALCTYETLEEATLHVGTITAGTWMLVQRDPEGGDEAFVLKTSEDEY